MQLNFLDLDGIKTKNLNGGEGEVVARMFKDDNCKIMFTYIEPNGSIGLHRHDTSIEINIVFAGHGKAICDGKEEILDLGVCHYCPKGSEHTIINTDKMDLMLYTIVAEIN